MSEITLNSVTDEQMADVVAVLGELQPVRCKKLRAAVAKALGVIKDDALQLVAAASYKGYIDVKDGLWSVQVEGAGGIRDTTTKEDK